MTDRQQDPRTKGFYYLEPMTLDDVTDVSTVERNCFQNPWPESAYRRELRDPKGNYYLVLRQDQCGDTSDSTSPSGRSSLRFLPRLFGDQQQQKDPIVGFAGMWVRLEEAHVTTIGVVPEHRGQGLGELLFAALFEEAIVRGAEWLTLEVRVSNETAQRMYEKYGLTKYGVRKRYYSDNGEDADIMWSPNLKDEEFLAKFKELREALLQDLVDRGLLLQRGNDANSGD